MQVKNYYTRQVEAGRIEFKTTAEEANRSIAAGERVPEPPKPTALPKRRYENPHSRSSTVVPMDIDSDMLVAQLPPYTQQLPLQIPHNQVIAAAPSPQDQSPPFKQSPLPPSIVSSVSGEQRALISGVQSISSKKAITVERLFPQQQPRPATPPMGPQGQMTPKGSMHQSPMHTPQQINPVIGAFHDTFKPSTREAEREQLQHQKPQHRQQQQQIAQEQQQQEIYPKPSSSGQREKVEERGREQEREEGFGEAIGHVVKEKVQESPVAMDRRERERDLYPRQQVVQPAGTYGYGAQAQDLFSKPPPGHPRQQQELYTQPMQHPPEPQPPRPRKRGQMPELVDVYSVKQEGHSTPSQVSQHDSKQQVHPQGFYGSQPTTQTSTQQKQGQQAVVQSQIPMVDRPRAGHSRHPSLHNSRPVSRDVPQQLAMDEYHAHREYQERLERERGREREIQRRREEEKEREREIREREREMEKEMREREMRELEMREREMREREMREREMREMREMREREMREREMREREMREREMREREMREREIQRQREEQERERMQARERYRQIEHAAMIEREKQIAAEMGGASRQVIDLSRESRESRGVQAIKGMVNTGAGSRDQQLPVTGGYQEVRRMDAPRDHQRTTILDPRELQERERREWAEGERQVGSRRAVEEQQGGAGIPGSRPISAAGHRPSTMLGPSPLQQLGRVAVTSNPHIIHAPPLLYLCKVTHTYRHLWDLRWLYYHHHRYRRSQRVCP